MKYKHVLIILVVILAIFTASIYLYTQSKLNFIKDKVLSLHPEITRINKTAALGSWGEFYAEFVLEVEADGVHYRLWTDGEGNPDPFVEWERIGTSTLKGKK
ncbi:hypothetical protein [Metabacillus sp. FJAT-52054]|uniref:DUF3139 domain-containing protein n=1 Tax=Metabacillus sediminis TaxID=3117746 RepID=A0ABZ2NIE6_9BACI